MAAVYAEKESSSRSKARGAGAKHVAVQRGAGGRKLRIDGTFASFYVPGQVTTGSVWDALAAPILLLPPARRRSILILGLGGGSAARLARALAPKARIVGVEYDGDVVKAARRWFDLDDLRVRVVLADAQSYLRRARGRFDVVLEDIFVGRGRRVHKPDWFPSPGLDLAAGRLAHGGLLVSNAIDEGPAVARHLAGLFPATLQVDVAGYDNRILVGGPPLLSGRALRAAVSASPVLASTAPSLRFRKLRGSAS